MRNKLVWAAAVAAAVALSGCGRDEGDGSPTAEEERQLRNAARMLEDNMIDVSPDSLVANEADLEDENLPPAEPANGQ